MEQQPVQIVVSNDQRERKIIKRKENALELIEDAGQH